MGFVRVHLYCAPIPFKMSCHVLGIKTGSHLICHAFMSSTCWFFCRRVKCIFSVAQCSLLLRELDVELMWATTSSATSTAWIAGKWYSLAIFACFLPLTPPIFCSLLVLCHDACVLILFTCIPCCHDKPHPINLLFVYLVRLASRSACVGALLESCHLFI